MRSVLALLLLGVASALSRFMVAPGPLREIKTSVSTPTCSEQMPCLSFEVTQTIIEDSDQSYYEVCTTIDTSALGCKKAGAAFGHVCGGTEANECPAYWPKTKKEDVTSLKLCQCAWPGGAVHVILQDGDVNGACGYYRGTSNVGTNVVCGPNPSWTNEDVGCSTSETMQKECLWTIFVPEAMTPPEVSPSMTPTKAPTRSPIKNNDECGTCSVSEDPHVVVFDGAQVSLLQVASLSSIDSLKESGSGQYWLVSSQNVHIQAKYAFDETLTDGNLFVSAVAIGGPFMNGTLIVDSLEGTVTYNGDEILSSPTWNGDAAAYSKALISSFETAEVNAKQAATGKVSIDFPDRMQVFVDRRHRHVNVIIHMRQQDGGQDGICGNFNELASDDTFQMVSRRFDPRVSLGSSLFG